VSPIRPAAIKPLQPAGIKQLRASTLRAAWWAWRAARRANRQLREGGLKNLAVPAPPDLPGEAEHGVRAALRRGSYTCLVQAAVRQTWEAAHGRPRDLVIGVNSPSESFQAHAWLDGDPDQAEGEFRELVRRGAQ
jgi:hypothetical protein